MIRWKGLVVKRIFAGTLAAAALSVGLAVAIGGPEALMDDVVSRPEPAQSWEISQPARGLSVLGAEAAESGPPVWESELQIALAASSGEYDPLLAEIERLAGAALSESARPYWQALADVTPAINSLRARHETDRYTVLSRSAVAVWHDLLAIYFAAAPSSDLRHQLLARYPAAAGRCRGESGRAGAGARLAAAGD